MGGEEIPARLLPAFVFVLYAAGMRKKGSTVDAIMKNTYKIFHNPF